jgi:feruloyl esterase
MSRLSRYTKFACVAAAASMTFAAAYAQRAPAQQTPATQTQQPVGRPLINRIPIGPRYPLRNACEALKSLSLPDTVILSAENNATGVFAPTIPPSPPGAPAITGLPAYCRVVGKATPTATSDIGFEVWLPLGAAYNGRYEQVGNGGFAGLVNYDGLGEGIRRGYATASTDDGHEGFQDSTFAQISHDKIVDFGWRALQQTTIAAKALIQAFYGAPPKYSYFFGCSDGGREALIEAQRFPNDFDGIIAGAAANAWTHQFTALAYNTQMAYGHALPFPALLPPASLSILSQGVRKQCVGKDGGLPGDLFLNDPRVCIIDWSKIQCAPGQNPATCLNAAQATAVEAIYAGAKNPAGQIYPGYEPGSEDADGGWKLWITGPLGIGPFPTFGLQTFFGEGFFANFVYHVPVYNLMTLDMTSGLAAADMLAPDLNATDPDLSAFRAHGGKLIQYAGWADPGVAPQGGIDYYEAVRSAMALGYADEQGFYRLFMAPGMMHCSGGPGANAFGNVTAPAASPVDADHDVLMALARWREMGTAPDKIIATKYVNDKPAMGIAFQRPLCPYPQLARYDGVSPDKTSAASFVCEARYARPVRWPLEKAKP